MQLLELAAPAGPVAGRNADLCLQLLRCFRNKRADIASAHVGADDDAALAVFAADLVRPRRHVQAGHFTERDEARAAFRRRAQGQGDGQAFQLLQVAAQAVGQAHDDVEAAVALEQGARLLPADGRGNRRLHVGNVEAVAGRLLAVDLHRQHGQPRRLLDLHFRRARYLAQHTSDLRRRAVEDKHVVAEQFHGHVAAHAGNQFIEAQLDRLRKLVVVARQAGGRRFDFRQQLLARFSRFRPLVARLEHDVAVGNIRRHGVRRDLGRSRAGEDARDFLVVTHQLAFQLLLHGQRLGQAGAGDAQGLDGDVALVQAGHEFAAHARGQQARQHDGHRRARQHDGRVAHHLVQQRRIPALGGAHDGVFLLRYLVADKQRHGGGDEGDRQQHGAQQGNHDRQGHRRKHAAFHARQREDGQVHDHDDQLAIQQGPARFLRCRKHFMKTFLQGQRPPEFLLRMGQAAHAVFHDHHGAIDDDAEIERAQAHQVGAHMVLHHARKREQHGQRNHHGRDDGRADIAEEQEQDGDHQHGAFEQVFLHRIDGLVDQHRAVIHGDGVHAFRQAAVDLDHLLVDRLRDGAAVLPDQHEDRAEHHFAAVFRGRARAQLAPQHHVGHVADADRHALHIGDDDVGEVVFRCHLARRAYQQLLALPFDIAGAHVAVVAFERRHHVLQADAVGGQFFRVGRHLVLLGVAADGIDFRHARDIAQLRLDDPVLDFAQVRRRVRRAIGLFRALLRFHRPQVDFAEARGNGAHLRRDAGWQTFLGFLQAFVDHLAGKIDVRAILEDHRHLRQAIARQRARLFQIRQAGHGRLDGERHALLGFQRRIAGGLGIDLHLHIGDVGHGVDGQLLIAVDAQAGHGGDGQHHQPALLDGEADQAFKHDGFLSFDVINVRGRRSPCPARISGQNCLAPRTACRRPGPA